MKEKTKQPFDIYRQGLTEDERQRLADFFVALDLHCRLPGRQARGMREDFKRAICHYAETGVPLDEALARLDSERLGGFYARPPVLWFPLDDAAKIYPISMKRNRMAVFRLSAYLDRDVVPELLQMALTFTIKRFPSFATTLKQGFFWHYLDSAKRRFRIERETDMPCRPLKVSRSGSQSFRVLYEKNRISAEFFHVLTDGVGGMTFLKALTAEYLRLEGVCARRDETLWNVEDTPCAEEFANEFARVPHSARASGFAQKAAVQMSGRLARRRPCRILHFKMDASRLKAVAGTYGATVGAYMLALMFVAGRAATDEQEGEAAIQVPVDMRKFHPSRTVRNFALYCGIRLPLQAAAGVETVVEEIARQLEQKASREAMEEMLTSANRLVRRLRYVPLAIKQPVARRIYDLLGDHAFSNTFSNLGVVRMPEGYAAHIRDMDFVLGGAATNRAACAMVTFGNTATFSVTKMTADPSFEEALYRLLCADGIAVRVEGSECCED